jgi:hypothetical protein
MTLRMVRRSISLSAPGCVTVCAKSDATWTFSPNARDFAAGSNKAVNLRVMQNTYARARVYFQKPEQERATWRIDL